MFGGLRKYAGAIILDPRGVVLQRRDDKRGIAFPGRISTFGGSFGQYESPRSAMYRELSEELRLGRGVLRVIDKVVFRVFDPERQRVAICHVFLVKSFVKCDVVLEGEIAIFRNIRDMARCPLILSEVQMAAEVMLQRQARRGKI